MSAQQKEMFDTFFKGFIMVAITIIGFFCVRLVNTTDRAIEDIQILKTNSAVMKNEIDIFKDNWQRFVDWENARQKRYDETNKP